MSDSWDKVFKTGDIIQFPDRKQWKFYLGDQQAYDIGEFDAAKPKQTCDRNGYKVLYNISSHKNFSQIDSILSSGDKDAINFILEVLKNEKKGKNEKI